MTEEQIEELENLLGYYEQHSGVVTGPVGWWTEDVVKLMRGLLPDWSAFKEAS